MRGRHAATALLLTVAALFGGCGGSDEAATPDPPPAVVQAPTSPLEAELDLASDPERRRFQLITLQRDADAAMVDCMAAAGFFYAPAPAEDAFFSGAFQGDGTRAWTAENGLGITLSFVRALEVDAEQQLPQNAGSTLSNEQYVASLTPEQAAAYDAALVGEQTATETGAFTPGGCFADSYGQVLRTVSLVAEFERQLDSLNSRLTADPRFQALQGEWSTCMAGAGFDYANENAMVDDIYAQLLGVELQEDQGDTRLADEQAVSELAAYELQVAAASFDCRQDIQARVDLLRFDYEQEFLDDNRFRLAELAAPSDPAGP